MNRLKKNLSRGIIDSMPIGSLLDNQQSNMSKTTIKRYLISALISFLTGFAIVFVSQVDSITLESLKDGSIIGIIFVCVRTGLKGVFEYFLSTFNK